MLCRPRPHYNELNKVAIGYKNPLCLTRAKQIQLALYNGHEILKDNHAPAKVHNTKDTLEMAEITRKRMNDKMNDPECVTRKVNIAPHDYSKENFLATFTPQKQLTPEQIFWSNDLMKLKSKALKEQTKVARLIKAFTVYPLNTPVTLVPKVLPTKSQVKIHIFTLIQMFSEFDKTCKKRITPTGLTEGERGFEQTKACYIQEVIPFFKTLKDNFEGIQKALTKEVKEIKDVFEELEAEVTQYDVDRKRDGIELKNLLIANDNLIAECLSQEVFCVATNSELNVAQFIEMYVANTTVEARCLALEAELANLRNNNHDNQKELINHFSKLEVNHLNLQLKYQNLKDSMGNNPPTPDKDTLDFDSVFVIGKIQASIQGKDNVIHQLKKKLSQLQETHSDTDRTPKHAIDVEPIVPRLRDNRDAHLDYLRHLKESVETICDIVEEAKAVRPRDRSIVSACRYTKHSQELLEYAIGTCPQGSKQRAKQLAYIPLIRKKQVTVVKPSDKSDSTTHPHVVTVKSQKTNVPGSLFCVTALCVTAFCSIAFCLDKMADVNAPSGQTPAMTPPLRVDDQILPHIRWVPIGRSNCYLDLEKSQSNPIHKIAIDLLKNTNFFRAFTASFTIPSIYIQQFWDTILYDKKAGCYRCQLDEQWFVLTKETLREALQITPVITNQAFAAPSSIDGLINFINQLGYPKLVRNLSNVVTNDLFQSWRALLTIINLCLTRKTYGFERPRAPEEFTQSIHTFIEDKRNLSRNTSRKKRATLIVIPSIWFTKLIIHHLQRRYRFHPRPDSPLHLPNKEPVGYLKFSAKGTKREVFGMPVLEASKTEEVPIIEPQVADEDADYQKILEESMKDAYALPRGTLSPVVIRKPASEKYQPLLEVPGKGKAKVTEEQSDSEDELEKVVLGAKEGGQDEGQARPGPNAQAEDQTRSDAGAQAEDQTGFDAGQAGPNPSDAEAKVQSITSLVVHAGSDREYMDLDVVDVTPQTSTEKLDKGFTATSYPKVQENLKLAIEEQVLLEEPASSSETLSSLQHLSRDFSFGDQFFSDKPSEAYKNAETKVESMVNVPIQQALSLIPLQTSPIIDLSSRPESPKAHQKFKATTTDTTTTTLPPPQAPQQSTTEAMISHGSCLYTLEQLDIPQQVSIDVSEVVTDAVDWAMQAPLRNRFKDIPEADMKEILHQRMWESEFYKSHEDHIQLFEAFEKSMNRDHSEELAQDLAEAHKKKKKSRESPKTPWVSISSATSSSTSGSFWGFGGSWSFWISLTEYQAWTTTSIRLRPSISLTLADLEMGEDMAPDEQAQSSDDKDIESAHISTVNLRQGWWKPFKEEQPATPKPAWSIRSSDVLVPTNNWASALASNNSLLPEDSLLAQTRPAYEIIKVFHLDVIHLQYQMKECHKLLTDSVDDPMLRHNVSKPLPLGGPPGQVTIQSDFFFNKDLEYLRYDQFWIEEECKYDIAAIAVRTHIRMLSVVRIEVFSMYGYDYMKKIVFRCADLNEYVIVKRDFKQLVIRQRVEDFQLGIESYQTQLNLTKPHWDAMGYEYKHDYTVIDSPRAAIFRDKYGVQMMIRVNEIHKFSDGTLQQIDEALDYRIKEFRINRMDPGLDTRFWTRKDVDQSEAFMFASWINHVEDSSSTKYEFVALAAAGKEAKWLRSLIHEIPIWPKPIAPISIRCVSAPIMARAYSQIYNGKFRHLDAAGIPSYSLHVLRLVVEPSVDEHIRHSAAVNFKNHLKTRWLSEALAVIGNHDFPKLWPALLAELKTRLKNAMNVNDFVSVNGVLATVNSLFKKFSGVGGDAVAAKRLVDAQRLCCRIFYSLNFLDLPEFFKDYADEWMDHFKNYLTYPVVEDIGADGLALVDGLRAAVCDYISHYMEKEEELFQMYLRWFADAVCSLLVYATGSLSRERLTVTPIKFLTTVSTSVHHAWFNDDQILQQITQRIMIPNVMLREEDEELFEINYIEFIRRDMEGSDLNTRRMIACELLKGIMGNYKDKISAKVSEQIRNCLALFIQNPAANWKHKDCAIYLVVSLATKQAGGAFVSTDLVDVGALKFFTTFRVLIPKPVALARLGDLVWFLCSDVNVVHSYAASCIEKLLLVKDNGVQARYTALDVGPILLALMTNLFGALEKPESDENQYIMRVSANPKNPVFNHCLFEAVAALVPRGCENEPTLVPVFEQRLFLSLQMILVNQVTELFPYAFQLLAQLVDLNRSPVLEYYMQIFHILLTPDLWKKSANVPALVRLLQSFLQQAPNELTKKGKLINVLGIFEILVSSPSTEEQEFYILNPVIENLGYDILAEYMNHIWFTLFTQLQNNATPRLVRCLIIFMSLFLVKHGTQTLVDSVNSVGANLFNSILDKFWIPTLKTQLHQLNYSVNLRRFWILLLRSSGATGYQATFVRLHNVGRREEDPLQETNSGSKTHLRGSIGKSL
nr:exportin-2 [Tanacetum cinerariifolium]